MSTNMDDNQIVAYVKEHKLGFVPGNCGYGADGHSIRQGVAVYEGSSKNPTKWFGDIIIDPSNNTIEDTIPSGVIDPVKERILRDLKATNNAYCDPLYVLYRAARE